MVPDSFYFHRSYSPINANLLIEWVNSVGINEVMTQCSMRYLLLSFNSSTPAFCFEGYWISNQVGLCTL